MCFQQAPGITQLLQAQAQVVANLIHRPHQPLARRDVVRSGIDGEARDCARHGSRERIEEGERVDGFIEKLHPHRFALGFGREDIDHIAAHPVGTLGEIQLVPRVLHVGEPAQQLALIKMIAALQMQHHGEVCLRVSQAIDRRHGGDDDGIGTL